MFEFCRGLLTLSKVGFLTPALDTSSTCLRRATKVRTAVPRAALPCAAPPCPAPRRAPLLPSAWQCALTQVSIVVRRLVDGCDLWMCELTWV